MQGAFVWIKEHFVLITIWFIIAIVLFLSMAIKIRLKKRRKFKSFLNEDLIDHLGDNLNERYYNESSLYSRDTYFYDQLMQYAINIAMSNIPKRQRYDKDGNYTSISASAVSDMQIHIRNVFTDNGVVLAPGYVSFIRDYKPMYKVFDFSKSILEFIEFTANPDAFEKYVADTPTEELDSGKTEELSQDSNLFDNNVSQEDNNAAAEPKVRIISSEVTDDVLREIDIYATKLTNKKKAKSPDIDTETEYKKNYGRLHRMFINGKSFSDDFVGWVITEKPESSVDEFGALIPEYIRYIKTK